MALHLAQALLERVLQLGGKRKRALVLACETELELGMESAARDLPGRLRCGR